MVDLDTIKKLALASYCGDRSSDVIGDEDEVALLNMIPDMIAEIERQREIIAGRTTAPTDAEIEAHAAAGGKWWVFAQWNRGGAEKSANIIHSWAPGVARYLRDGQPDARWWALDAAWAPCAWPEVSDGR